MHVRTDGYIGVAGLGSGLTNVCVVREIVAGPVDRIPPDQVIARALSSDPGLRDRFARARQISRVSSLGPLAVEARAAGCPGLLLAGDAAGFVDPMTGDGLRFALRGGELAAEAALFELQTGIPAHHRLDEARRREFSGKWRVNRALRALVGVAGRCPDRGSDLGPLGAARSLSHRRSWRHPARALMIGLGLPFGVPLVLLVVMLMMLAESLVSRSHERTLREQGAIEPPGDVYATMRWAYPGAFLAMAAEGMLLGPAPARVAVTGVLLMAVAKALKWWAMAVAWCPVDLSRADRAGGAARHARTVRDLAPSELHRRGRRVGGDGVDDRRSHQRTGDDAVVQLAHVAPYTGGRSRAAVPDLQLSKH